MLAKITIMGMENFLKNDNDSLFKSIVLPDGINKETLVDTILLRCAELEVYYSDAYYMKAVTEHFFKKHLLTFEKWVEGQEVTWNPIENYDRYEDWKDNGTNKKTGEITGESSAADTTEVTGSGETKSNVTTYDSGTYKPDGQTESSSGSTSESTTGANTKTNSEESGENENIHSGRIHGNIGVTQASEMLENWREAWKWNIYDEIANLYKDEFCIGVYV